MFQNFDLDSGLSVYILDFSDKKIVSFKIYNVTRKFYEYSDYTPTLNSVIFISQSISRTDNAINQSLLPFQTGVREVIQTRREIITRMFMQN